MLMESDIIKCLSCKTFYSNTAFYSNKRSPVESENFNQWKSAFRGFGNDIKIIEVIGMLCPAELIFKGRKTFHHRFLSSLILGFSRLLVSTAASALKRTNDEE